MPGPRIYSNSIQQLPQSTIPYALRANAQWQCFATDNLKAGTHICHHFCSVRLLLDIILLMSHSASLGNAQLQDQEDVGDNRGATGTGALFFKKVMYENRRYLMVRP